MTESDSDEPREKHPASWENELVGRATELAGRALHNDEMVEEGTEQREIAHEVHDEAKEEAKDDRAD